MRNPSISTVQFSVGNPGEIRTLDELTRYVQALEQRTAIAISLLAAGHIDPTYTVPEKPRPGDIRYAAGAPYWNPGGGEGVYFYNSGGMWTQLG